MTLLRRSADLYDNRRWSHLLTVARRRQQRQGTSTQVALTRPERHIAPSPIERPLQWRRRLLDQLLGNVRLHIAGKVISSTTNLRLPGNFLCGSPTLSPPSIRECRSGPLRLSQISSSKDRSTPTIGKFLIESFDS
ncbi:hypothetical protein M6B38_162685 [Iris pallida]|uniref:Uncharacterized protein n=1 Tax=Iris pallida TaxID=29817 RepID=A0AAX6EZX1_IRIPA|nr:hypothetical protein M6B38_162685 [Iris pallida]